eukprot:625291-Pyramimonas_sp.AAC.1
MVISGIDREVRQSAQELGHTIEHEGAVLEAHHDPTARGTQRLPSLPATLVNAMRDMEKKRTLRALLVAAGHYAFLEA